MYSNDDLTVDILSIYRDRINRVLKQFPIKLVSNTTHIIDRLKDRDLNNMDLRTVLQLLYRTYLPEFIYLATLEETKRPFKIEIKNEHIIIVLSRIDEYKWKINTVLDPKIHSKHEKTGNYQKYINTDIPLSGDMVKW